MDTMILQTEKRYNGYAIVWKDKDRNLYLQSMRNGKPKWILDYTYGRTYSTEGKAKEVIKVIQWHYDTIRGK